MKDIFDDLFGGLLGLFDELLVAVKKRDFKETLQWLISIPIVVVLGILAFTIYAFIYIVYFIFLYPVYVRSAFYKKFKIKFDLGRLSDNTYLFYNYIVANKLDFKFVDDYQNGKVRNIYMEKNGIIYVFDEFTSMWFENNECLTYMEDDMEDIEISKYINEHYKNYKMPVRVVIKAKNLSKPSLDETYQCEHVYVFKKLSDLKKL